DTTTVTSNVTLTNTTTVGPAQTITFNVTGTTTSTSPVADLADFIGTGTVTLPVDATGASGVSFANGNGDFTSDTFAGATAIILVYNFAPFASGGGGGGGGGLSGVPEPDVMIVWGVAGGVALLAWGRRQRLRSRPPAP